ncbi:beta-lactamase/transpeptidase-like protein [Xylogone sp. PMI_703]|nr:beta-lactamase/transpeptidase-like protein [Xylogone sp. PMI_703]
MSSFEEKIQKACEERYIPGAVCICGDSKGEIVYQKAFGSKTLKGDPPHPPLSVDDCFVLASCTKLMTSVAALQCVERGQIGLDDDLSNVIPEFQNISVLTGFEESGEPILKKAVNKITLRMLLTHTAGFTYPHGNPFLYKWVTYVTTKNPLNRKPTMLEQMQIPLLFEPGMGWEYGISVDWAGIMVSRLNGNITLQSYLEKNVWQPLDIKLMTFHPDEHPEVQKRLVGMTHRGAGAGILGISGGDDEKVEYTDDTLFSYPLADEWGGAGGIGAPTDYIKILRSLLVNDGQLLSPATVDEMFTPQMNPEALKFYERDVALPERRDFFASLPPGTPVQWGLGGRLVMGDLETGLKKGSMQWSGLPNLIWTIDRTSGLCMFYASNLVPFGDKKIYEYANLFQKEMCSRFGKKATA